MSSAPTVSKYWRVVRQHASVYTDGSAKVDRAFQQQLLDHADTSTAAPHSAIIACWNGGDLALMDTTTGQVVRQLVSDEEDEFTAFTLSPSHAHIAAVARRSTMLTVFDNATGDSVLSFRTQPPHTQPIIDLSYDPSGRYIASISIDRTCKVFDTHQNGSLTHSFKVHSARPTSIAFHPNAGRLEVVTGDDSGVIVVNQLRTRTHLTLQHEHMARITSITFTADGRHCVTGGADSVIVVWDVTRNYKSIKTIPVFELIESVKIWPHNHPLPVGSKAKRDGAVVIVSGGEKGAVKLWDSVSGQCLYSHSIAISVTDTDSNDSKSVAHQIVHLHIVPAPPLSQAESPLFSLMAVTREQNFYFYNSNDFVRQRLYVGFNDEIIDIRCHPDNRRAIVATNSAQVRIFDMLTLDADLLDGHTDTVLSVDVSKDGRFVITASKDRTVRVFDLDSNDRRCVAVGVGHSESVGAVAFSRTAGPLVAVSGARDRTLKLWDLQSLTIVTVSGDWQPLSLLCHSTIVRHERDINCVSVSPNDKIVASGSEDRTIQLSSLSSQSGSELSLAPLATLKGHRRGVWSVKFSPYDKVLASCSGDKTIRLWSLTDYACLRTFEGHTGSVKGLSFLNDGLQLASVGDDGVMRVWLIKTNECVNTFTAPQAGAVKAVTVGTDLATMNADTNTGGTDEEELTEKLWSLDITRDGAILVTGGTGSVLNIWQDFTALHHQAQLQFKSQSIVHDQQLVNLMRHRKFDEAFALAVKLKQPRRLHSIVQEIYRSDDSESVIDAILADFTDVDLNHLLVYVRDWNTNAKTSRVANQLIASLLRCYPSSTLMRNSLWRESLSSLLVHCDKHFHRIDRLMQKSYLLDFALEAMNVYDDSDSDSDGDGGCDSVSGRWRLADHAAVKIEEEKEGDDANEDFFDIPLSLTAATRPSGTGGSRILSLARLPEFQPDEAGDGMDEDEDGWSSGAMGMESNWSDADADAGTDDEAKAVEPTKSKQSKKKQSKASVTDGADEATSAAPIATSRPKRSGAEKAKAAVSARVSQAEGDATTNAAKKRKTRTQT